MSKSILMNTDMVRALLSGQKRVTRRLVRCRNGSGKSIPLPTDAVYTGKGPMFYTWAASEPYHIVPPYQPGDVLYVRETWAKNPFGEGYIYPTEVAGAGQKWRPSRYMPREAARIFLRVTNVRVERLQDISADPPGPENQVVQEGFKHESDFIATWARTLKPADRTAFGWDANPWVWVIEFERISKEEAEHAKPE